MTAIDDAPRDVYPHNLQAEQAVLDSAAKQLDVTPEELRSALGDALDAQLDAEVKADPKIGTARRGALPIMVGGQMIGAMAVSGAPGGDKDEVCVKAGLASIASRLK